jgi:putative colanic acid biosynthesis acetyltransferase WcaF
MSSVYAGSYQNRLGRSNQVRRLAWGLVWTLLGRTSPTPLFGWRRFLARAFGARLHARSKIYPSVRIWAPWNLEMGPEATLADRVDCYSVDQIFVGEQVTVSQDAMLCTASHDICDPERALVTKPIRLERGSWVFARAFVGPGVTLGEGAVIAAGAVVVKSVAAWKVVGGNPARVLKDRVLRGEKSGIERT